ncbi:unnamed protein product [Medioppia subpectinata]|uniref:Uncharacterized protein n=1 Tax=Medioppia subpectinata TaxID=1979941 RepID=A0A7R9KNZ5_9ACAR|nr:unnamed protein product [Medioppia subpectinata]CAG2106742.1 unnamed protein product [Medioppia subpectinata]
MNNPRTLRYNFNTRKQKTLKRVKICLEVLYVLAIIGCIITIVLCGIALSLIDDNFQQDNLTKEHVIAVLIIVVLWLVVSLIGLVGIIKEHKVIVIVLLVFTIVGIIANFVTKEYGLGSWGVVCAMLTVLVGTTIGENFQLSFEILINDFPPHTLPFQAYNRPAPQKLAWNGRVCGGKSLITTHQMYKFHAINFDDNHWPVLAGPRNKRCIHFNAIYSAAAIGTRG